MFNIDFEDDRVKSVLRTLQYAAVTVLVVIGTIILVFAGQGYDIGGNGQVIRNGLILVNSVPEDAQVHINGQPESDLTPSSFPVPDGDYDVLISREGYRDWSKTISVTGSEVEWLYYPLLIPNELDAKELSVFLKPEFIGVAPSGDRLLIRQDSPDLDFSLLTFSSSGVTDEDTIQLSEDLLDLGNGKVGTFEFEGWASDNRHVLVTHNVGTRSEYLMLDIEEPEESINLNQEFELGLREVRFIDGNFEQLYAIVTNDLRRINLADNTISTPIVRNLGRYVLHKDQFVVFVRNDGDGSQLGLIENDQEPEILQELPRPAGNYRLEFAEFDDVFYLALLDLDAGQMSLTANPQLVELGTTQTPLLFKLANTKYIAFSRNGQFITMQADSKFLTYDLDRRRRTNFSVNFELSQNDEAIWLDGYHLSLADKNNQLHLFEFDGGNQTELVKTNPDFNPIYNTGQNVLYNLSPTAEGGRVFLQGTSFTIQDN